MTKPDNFGRKLLIGGLLLALAMPGCGGGDSDTESSGSGDAPALAKGEFIAQANAICDRADKRQAAAYKTYLKENGEDKSKAGEEKLVTDVGLPPIRLEIEELRELGAPVGDEDEVAEMLDALEAAVKANEEKPLSVYTANSPFKAAEGQAKKYGLTKCGFT